MSKSREVIDSQLSGKTLEQKRDFARFCLPIYSCLYESASSRHERRLVCAAMSSIKYDIFSWMRPESLSPFWLEDSFVPTTLEIRYSGGRPAVMDLIRSIDFSSDCGVWTKSFLAGLKDSGAIFSCGENDCPWRYFFISPGRSELDGDFLNTEDIFISVNSGTDSFGRKKVRSSSFVFQDISEPDAGWLAGLLSGMRLKEHSGHWVLESRYLTSRAISWLSSSGVWFCGGLNRDTWISPFYLPLVSHLCPPLVGSRWESIKHKRFYNVLACDWLPLSTWEVVFSKSISLRWPNRGWGLPWALNYSSRARRGIDRRLAHRWAVERGVGSPAKWLKDLCVHFNDNVFLR